MPGAVKIDVPFASGVVHDGRWHPRASAHQTQAIEAGERDIDGERAPMVNLSAPFIDRPVATTLLTLGVALAGAIDGVEPAQTTFDIDSVRKDLRTMIEEAGSFGARLPVAEQALACFDAASADGLGARDCAMLPVRWSKQRSR